MGEMQVLDNDSVYFYAGWFEGGATSMRERARAKIDEILGPEPERILPPEIEQKIKDIAHRAISAQTG